MEQYLRTRGAIIIQISFYENTYILSSLRDFTQGRAHPVSLENKQTTEDLRGVYADPSRLPLSDTFNSDVSLSPI